MIPATQAISLLRKGNGRFAAAARAGRALAGPAQRHDLALPKAPFAVILGCADSRVPPEIVFDQGLGALFTIRVAGNVAGPTQIGTVEFAVQNLGVRLAVVLGHTGCLAVGATLDALAHPEKRLSSGLRSIVDLVGPVIEPLVDMPDPAARLAAAVRRGVHSTVTRLQETSSLLAESVQSGGLRIVGAEYSLDTGLVEFLDGA